MVTRRFLLFGIISFNALIVLFYFFVSSIEDPTLQGPNDNTPSSSTTSEAEQVSWIREKAKGLVPRPTQLSDPNERFLAYLPHSGFHNQRISLENALLLAKYLNRTLLVPPVFLGPATEWRLFPLLLRRIMLQTKRGLNHCRYIPKNQSLPAECLNFFQWTTIGWDFFYDMNKISEQQPIRSRNDHSFSWMEQHLGIDRKKDIWIIDDLAHYDYQVYDDPNSQTPLNTARYLRRIDVAQLEKVQEKVLHMGSLFATGRVLAELKEHAAYQQFLRRTMILTTPVLVETSNEIVEQLGGLASFVGLHLRVGDGMFVKPAPENVENMFQQLLNITGIQEQENYQILPTTIPKGDDDSSEEDSDGEGRGSEVTTTNKGLSSVTHLTTRECRDKAHLGGAFTPIYIATDGIYPRRNPLFRKLFDHFHCIFTLDDFSELLTDLKAMKNTDGVGLSKDLIPMVDAVVAAKGRWFLGTPKSTFSTYVSKQLHVVYTPFDKDGNLQLTD